MVVQVVPLGETCSWNERAYAASQLRSTPQIDTVAPRSIWIHCGSLNALDQRVPVLPSTAAGAADAAFSVDDAVAGPPGAQSVLPAPRGAGVRHDWEAARTAS